MSWGFETDEYGYLSDHIVRRNDLADELKVGLDRIFEYGEFACMTQYSQHINPGLEFPGSIIPLPLVERDAVAIKSKSVDAPSEHGDDTVAGGSGRKDWQIDTSHFRCSNPAWPAFLDSVVSEALQKLGMSQYEVEAVPLSLILSEEGSRFRLHNESEKQRKLKVGQLVICLPSRHEGGEVQLSYGKQCHSFASAAHSGFDITALAWYSDVSYEVGPLTSGNRLVLTYNLMYYGEPQRPSAKKLRKQQARLQETLQSWVNESLTETKIIYMLEHKYTRSALSTQKLKGRDPHIIRCLKQACQETGFYLLLALVDSTEGCVFNPYYGVDRDATDLDYVTTVEGYEIASCVSVRKCKIIGFESDKNRWANSEDGSDIESTSSENGYRDSALLIVSIEGILDFIRSCWSSSAGLLQMVCFSTGVSPVEATVAESSRVIRFLTDLEREFESAITEPRLLGLFLKACKTWSSQELYDKAVRSAVRKAQGGVHNDRSFTSFMTVSTKFTTTDVAGTVASIGTEFMSSHTEQEFNECFGELSQNVYTYKLNRVLDFVKMFLSEEMQQPFKRWRCSIPRFIFETKDSFMVLDLPFILGLIQERSDDDEWITTGLLPKLGQCADRYLLYSLLLKFSADDGDLALKSKASLARRLLETALPKLHLVVSDFESDSRPSQGTKCLTKVLIRDKSRISAKTAFLRLLRSCFKCGLGEQCMDLLRNTYTKLEQAITRAKRHGITPEASDQAAVKAFLEHFVDILHRHTEPPPFLAPPLFRELFLLLFKRYIHRGNLGNPPELPTTWSHKPRHCAMGAKCAFCIRIQKFLAADMSYTKYRFHPDAGRHIEKMLPRQHYSCEKVSDTDETGAFCILKMTKLSKESEYEEDRRKFDDRLRTQEKRLLPFRQPIVQRLLGNEAYRELIMLGSAPFHVSNSRTSGTKRGAGESPGQPASTRQRTGDGTN